MATDDDRAHPGPRDAELVQRVREGDPAATDLLFRRHRDGARRFALRLTDEVSADDLVSDGFARVFDALGRGAGPDAAFRPYLLSTIRNAHVSRLRAEQRFLWVEDHAGTAAEPAAGDGADARHESEILARAFRSLPERWQVVLWHTLVEGDDLATVGTLLGLAPNAAGVLAFRAREGLRQAYLQAHVATATGDACRRFRRQLARYAKGRGGARQRREVEEHLAECRACAAALIEIRAIDDRLGTLLPPAVLGMAYAATTSATATATATATPSGPSAHGPGHSGDRSWHRAGTLGAAVAAAAAVAVSGWALAAVVGSGPAPGGDRAQPSVAAPAPGPHGPTTHAPPPHGSLTPSSSPTSGDPVIVPVAAPATAAATAPVAAPSDSPSSTPSSSPGEPQPSGTGEPTAHSSPPGGSTQDPSPTSGPTDEPPPGSTRDDLALTQGYQSDFGSYHHVQMRPRSPFETTYVRIRVAGLAAWTLHTEDGYRATTCETTPPSGSQSELLCRVGAGDDLLGLDLTVDGPLDLVAEVFAERNEDPQPANNVVSLRSGSD